MPKAYISIGSNLGDRAANLRRAIAAIREIASVHAVSCAYETSPVGYTAQPWFLNAVLAVELTNDEACSPEAPQLLLDRLLAIEHDLGRLRSAADIPKGPRLIDLDIILYADCVIASPAITIPHPAMHLRRFVLEPLAEIAPNAYHPLLKRTSSQLLAALPPDGADVRKLQTLN